MMVFECEFLRLLHNLLHKFTLSLFFLDHRRQDLINTLIGAALLIGHLVDSLFKVPNMAIQIIAAHIAILHIINPRMQLVVAVLNLAHCPAIKTDQR